MAPTLPLLDACTPGTFNLAWFGAEALHIEASVVNNYIDTSSNSSLGPFCNVTTVYTHPGQNDSVGVEAWLPIDGWNGLLLATGGAGYLAGRSQSLYPQMSAAVHEKYATTSTDAGLVGAADGDAPWALLSPGNVDLYSLQNFAFVSLNDQAIIGKSVIHDFYGEPPKYSYWSGCSQGGRQGLMLAQRYPTAYDGILANAPAIYWNHLLSSIYWPYQAMLDLGVFPHECEIDTINAAAVTACDGLDGAVDGIISDPDACLRTFNVFDQVGKDVEGFGAGECEGLKVSQAAAELVHQVWQGITTVDGKVVANGVYPGADLTGNLPMSPLDTGTVQVQCSNGTCVGSPVSLSTTWLKGFLLRDWNAGLSRITHAEFDQLLEYGKRYDSIIGTSDPDLTAFREGGGKMMTYQGLYDIAVSPRSTAQYYNEVTAIDPSIHDYYRLFEVPGFAHCQGVLDTGTGDLLNQLRAWVESGTAPESTPIEVTTLAGQARRIVCPYPHKAQLGVCEEAAKEECWECV
ncbi:tannase and feruloyl esterase [Xylariaceae sp. FL0016]|nr:tannase and feruloyl esterase [Xylariaceae sp. FL0016]